MVKRQPIISLGILIKCMNGQTQVHKFVIVFILRALKPPG